ncbi:MAG: primosomal protein N' [Coriobacteriales bacterium]|nr:primosomal protein N' [Coriobacteriales bacterium]
MKYARVILDIPARALDAAFDYEVPASLQAQGQLSEQEQKQEQSQESAWPRGQAQVGCCVLVDFAGRPALGYIVGLGDEPAGDFDPEKIKPLRKVLSTPYFDEKAAELAAWIAREYLSPLSATIRLFTPPGSAPRLKKDEAGAWTLEQPDMGPVDDRWVSLTVGETDAADPADPADPASAVIKLPANAVKQRAIVEALRVGEMRIAELALEIANPAASLKALEKRGIVRIESRRRIRGQRAALPPSADITALTSGQAEAQRAIAAALAAPPAATGSDGSSPAPSTTGSDIFLLDGVTGSGKTEVYLQAIRQVLEQGGGAIVLVPEISLTPQTVARFRSRFGEQVAVLHSRLSAGERFDQWDLVRSGTARVVVGARSALFAPVSDLKLIVIDEEHEATYKQSSSPRYVTRDVAIQLAQSRGASLILGSATPSLETFALMQPPTSAPTPPHPPTPAPLQPLPTVPLRFHHLLLPERASGKPLPPIQIVNLAAEFQSGNKSMFSRALRDALSEVIERREKAVLLLNKRGFASFLLCRDCGYVPMCENCATSLTYHESPPRLLCHHCGAAHPVPPVCPECQSPYLRQLGKGTQFADVELKALLPEGTPIVRMDADSTRGKDGHERCLETFIAADHGVLLGTQMIAKGLDFPEVTLVGVIIADTSLKFPDFRAAEHTYQLLEQVAGRAGRAEKDGRVIVQTYWPEHVAIRAAAAHRRALLLEDERATRSELGYPPYARLANILIWGKELKAVTSEALKLAQQIEVECPEHLQLLGPSPCVLARRQGNQRWHILIKAPVGADIPGMLAPVLKARKTTPGVNVAADIDPYDLM